MYEKFYECGEYGSAIPVSIFFQKNVIVIWSGVVYKIIEQE